MERAKIISPQSFKNRVIILVSIWLILLLVSLSAVSFVLAAFDANHQVQSIANSNWSGYVYATDFTYPEPQITGIRASWIVPEVNTAVVGYSSVWVGIGGKFVYMDQTLIQMGTAQDCVVDDQTGEPKETYYAWYELIPDSAIGISDFTVSPGDQITAYITLVNPNMNLWQLVLMNNANGDSFSKDVTYDSSQLSAEWVVERPQIHGSTTTLADFGNATFTDAYVKTTSTAGSLSEFWYAQLRMTDSSNKPLVEVFPVNENDGFTVAYVPVK